jgi:hypothetical protein
MLLTTPGNNQLSFTQGDTPTLTLIATDDQGNPQNLTGATISTQINGANGVGPVVFGNGQHTLANQSTNPGQFTLALTAPNTTACGEGTNKEIISTITIAGVILQYRGNALLNVYLGVPAP